MFADIVNVLIFKGKQIIHEDSLRDLNGTSPFKTDKNKLHEQERDVFKLWKGYGINLVLFGVENQTEPYKEMPFSVISYDGASYKSQLLRVKKKLVNGKINVFDIGAMTMDEAAMFKSDFREVAEHFIKVRNDREYVYYYAIKI